jgi:hypothetical protein
VRGEHLESLPLLLTCRFNVSWLELNVTERSQKLPVLDCTGPNLIWDPHAPSSTSQIRVILNDAVVPLTGVEGCPDQRDGLCPMEKFIKAQKKLLESVDWDWACHGDWTIPEGDAWQTTTGDPPQKGA